MWAKQTGTACGRPSASAVAVRERLAHLGNPDADPVPALAADDPDYRPWGDYWRGGVWAPTTYMVLLGLRGFGFELLARRIVPSASLRSAVPALDPWIRSTAGVDASALASFSRFSGRFSNNASQTLTLGGLTGARVAHGPDPRPAGRARPRGRRRVTPRGSAPRARA